jgi:hypothetical protein
MRVSAHGFETTFDVRFNATGFQTLATPSRRSTTQQHVVDSFSLAFRQAPVGRNGNGVIESGSWRGLPDRSEPSTAKQWMLVLVALSLLACVLQPSDRRMAHVNTLVLMFLGAIAYLLVLLYVYVYGFRTYEAIRVISFGRYASTWFLAWALTLIASIGHTAAGRRAHYIAGLAVLIAAIPWAVSRAPNQDPAAVIVARAREAVQQAVRRVDNVIPKTSSTYVIWQETNGFQFHLTSYELSPRRTNTWCWALGEKPTPEDIWTCPLSAEEFAAALDSFDYVLVMQGNEQLWRRYGSLFAPATPEKTSANVLFKVSKDDKPLQLRLVPVL